MPSADVRYPMPLTRLNPVMPGQFGVPGAWTETGLRMHSTGAVFYVDLNHPDTNDQRDGTDPTAPLETVATALTKCQAYRGDVIAIMANDAWEYGGVSDYNTIISESVTVDVPGVRIVGVSQSSSFGVYWRPATAAGTCITVEAIDVLVEGIAFMGRGGGTGVHAVWTTDGEGDNLTVRHCFFDDVLTHGITLDESWYCDIHHNEFDHPDYGIYTNPATMTSPAYGQIHHNFFNTCDVSAISLEDADRMHIYENSIYNFDAASGDAGTAADCLIDLTTGSRNQVHHNTLPCVLPAGVAWDYDATCTAGANDAWIQNFTRDGQTVSNPT